jgi:hypothetical protein
MPWPFGCPSRSKLIARLFRLFFINVICILNDDDDDDGDDDDDNDNIKQNHFLISSWLEDPIPSSHSRPKTVGHNERE